MTTRHAIGDTVLIRDTTDVCALPATYPHTCQRGAVGLILDDDARLIGGLGYWVECEDGRVRGYLDKQLEAAS